MKWRYESLSATTHPYKKMWVADDAKWRFSVHRNFIGGRYWLYIGAQGQYWGVPFRTKLGAMRAATKIMNLDTVVALAESS